MSKTDKIIIEILPDGILKTTTDPISAANHQSADAFIKAMERLAGGTTTVTKRRGGHTHTHVAAHEEQEG